jgi:hypothetical protein
VRREWRGLVLQRGVAVGSDNVYESGVDRSRVRESVRVRVRAGGGVEEGVLVLAWACCRRAE